MQPASGMETSKSRSIRVTPGRVTLASGAVILTSVFLPWVTSTTGWDYYDASTGIAKLLFDRPETEGIGLFFTGLVAALCGVVTILLGTALLRRELRPTAPSRSSLALLYGGAASVAATFPIVNIVNVLTQDVGDFGSRFGLIEYGLWIWLLAALVAAIAALAGARGQSRFR